MKKSKPRIRFGPASIGGAKVAVDNLKEYKENGMTAAEVEFTYGVYIKNNKDAKRIGDEAKKLDIRLSIHAPYYINLASKDKDKIRASKKRILNCCERGHYLRAKVIVFHPAYYSDYTKEECFQIVKKAIQEMQKVIKKNRWKIKLAPETTGKKSQFGSLDELLRLRKETKCSICVDFVHMKAREGRIDYRVVFKKIKKIPDLHTHFSGIEYGERGERRHLVTPVSEIRKLLSWIKKYNLSVTIINESPQPFEDTIKSLKVWKSLN